MDTPQMETPPGGAGLKTQTIGDGLQTQYIASGLALVRLRPGTKRPSGRNWQQPGHGIKDAAAGAYMDGVGVHHLDSRTCCIDVDDFTACDKWMRDRGVDLTALLTADDAVQIRSGREGRAKLLYRLPDGVPWLEYFQTCPVKGADGKTRNKLELRCAGSATQSQQDVLPPSIHPDTGKPYTWGGAGDWHNLPTLPDAVLTLWREALAEKHAAETKIPGRAWQHEETGVIDAFNAAHDVGAILEAHGYTPCGARWLSPGSMSGTPGIVRLPNSDPPRVYSHHADKLHNAHGHDAFSLFTVLEHGGDASKAFKAARVALGLDAPPRQPQQYKLLTGADVEALPALAWRIKGVLPARGLAQLYGPPASGKSFLTFDMAAAIAEGRDWFGYRVTQAPTVYVALEGEAGFPQRVEAWRIHYARPFPDAMRMVMQPMRINDYGDVCALSKAITDTLPQGGVTIIDTQNRAAPDADENASADMGRILEGAKRLADLTAGLVVLVAHTGKDAERGVRGHSSQRGAMDAAIAVKRNGDAREWCIDKSKDGRDGERHPFTLSVVELGTDEDGDLRTSCVIAPGGGDAPVLRPVPPAQALAIKAYETACRAGRGCLDEHGRFIGLHLDEWRDAFYAVHTGDTKGAKEKAFQRVRRDLQEAQRVTVNSDVYRVTLPHVSLFESQFTKARLQADSGQVADMSGTRPATPERTDTDTPLKGCPVSAVRTARPHNTQERRIHHE